MPHAAENSFKRCTAVVITQRLISRIMCIVVSFNAFSTAFRWRHWFPRLLPAERRRAARDRIGRTRPVFLRALKKVGAWSGRRLVGLRQGRQRERNIMVEMQKFCKKLSRGSGHGKSFGFAVSHPFTGKDDTMAGTHHHSKRAAFKAEFERGGGAVRDPVKSSLLEIPEKEMAEASGAAKGERTRTGAALKMQNPHEPSTIRSRRDSTRISTTARYSCSQST